jgi:hypothetical protein
MKLMASFKFAADCNVRWIEISRQEDINSR